MRWKVGCGGEFSAPSGQITSPNYPQRYGDNLVCNYTITAAPDTYIVATFIDRFDIENHPLCVYDRLSAYQGNSTSSPIMARYCGSQLPAPIVSRSSLFLQFRTDGSINRAGFKFNYTTQGFIWLSNSLINRLLIWSNLIECGGRITSPTIIRSPSHPDTYYNNLNCTWTVEASANQVVDIKYDFDWIKIEKSIFNEMNFVNRFQSLTLETHRDCRYDWIAVYEGVEVNDTQLLGRFCGNFTYQLPRIKSRGQRALIHFRTDWSVSHGGFSAAVRFTSGPSQGCGGLLNLTASSSGASVQLRAPDAALSPGANGGELDCQWIVLAPPTRVVRLQFTQMDMTDSGCSEDFIEVRIDWS